MCGIAGIINKKNDSVSNLDRSLETMNFLQKHRGPDGNGVWTNSKKSIGIAHTRLSIIDIEGGNQPKTDKSGNSIVFNGEIYNYIELKKELDGFYNFETTSDTEVLLASYLKWGEKCVDHLEGMFAFAIWNNKQNKLFCARDHFGIKPFYFYETGNLFFFASEAKALLPFVENIELNNEALQDYLTFQLVLDGKTLFKNIFELPPAHALTIKNGVRTVSRFWQVYYNVDNDHTESYFLKKTKKMIENSTKLHTRSDVEVGSYLSGGIDSSIISALGNRYSDFDDFKSFLGKFSISETYDESKYARSVANMHDLKLKEVDITKTDFINNIEQLIYHLDYPVAGPGSFPQFQVSQEASKHVKVVLGGQGGDEIFGGYVRYLIAYFEQCIKGGIEGTLDNGNFIVTYQSIIPNLQSMENYKPLLKEFWKDGLFDEPDKRYFRLINRSLTLDKEINRNELGKYSAYETFRKYYYENNTQRDSYFDNMTNFDMKTLLPGLLHVEDRVSMAHGLESRVPFLNHKLVEFVATIPANIKFKNGTLKKVLINAMKHELPKDVYKRKNKMGFPVPLNEWVNNGLGSYVHDIFNSQKSKDRAIFNSDEILNGLHTEGKFGRKIWGLLSLELWHKQFIDNQSYFSNLLKENRVA